VALRTRQRRVRPGQRESHQVVIETCRLPGAGVMARLAGLGKAQSYVIWIRSFPKIREVAPDTVRRCALKLSSNVAGLTLQSRVHSRQREPRDL
jgi:hypothetical protein